MSRISKVAVCVLLGSTALSTAHAATLAQADPAPADTSEVQTADTTSGAEEIIVTGTREVGTKAALLRRLRDTGGAAASTAADGCLERKLPGRKQPIPGGVTRGPMAS